MTGNAANESACGHAYEYIKSQVIAYQFKPGHRIYLEPLATQLGMSTTPVRNALNRLVDEGLVIRAPRRGFIAMTLSECEVQEQYARTRTVLTDAFATINPEIRLSMPMCEPIADVLRKLSRKRPLEANALANYTGETFLQLATLTKDTQVISAISSANDKLFYVRTSECRLLDNAREEPARRCEQLSKAILDYHDRRLALLPIVLEVSQR